MIKIKKINIENIKTRFFVIIVNINEFFIIVNINEFFIIKCSWIFEILSIFNITNDLLYSCDNYIL